MEKILSKEEISELLATVKEGDVDGDSGPTGAGGGRTITRLDLVSLPGPDKWNMPNLDIVLDAFARYFSASLTNRLQRSVAVQLSGIESMQFEPALQEVAPYGMVGILDMSPLKVGGLLIFDVKLAFAMLEMKLGGAAEGKEITLLDRNMTNMETDILSIIMEDSGPDLRKAFSPIESIQFSLLKIETNPRLVSIVTPETGVVSAQFTVTINEFSAVMTLVIPHESLEPMRERLRDTVLSLSSQQNDSWPESLRQNVCLLQTTVAGQIAQVRLKMRDILNFQVGDVLELGGQRNSQVKVLVGGQCKFRGVVGVRNGNKAVRINEIFLQGADNGNN